MKHSQNPTARDYFYEWAEAKGLPFKNHALSDEILSMFRELFEPFEKIYGKDFLKMRDETPNSSDEFSNFPNVDDCVKEIISKNDSWLPRELFQDIFVGVLREKDIDALAADIVPDFSGKLITYSAGLMNAISFFTNMYTHTYFKLQRSNIQFTGEPGNYTYEHDEFTSNVLAVFDQWKANDLRIEFLDTMHIYDQFEIEAPEWARLTSTMADSFIVAHEVAHHLVGDTGFPPHMSDDLRAIEGTTALLKTAIEKYLPNEVDQKEVRADMVAVFLLIGPPSNAQFCSSMDLYTAAIGALINLAAMSVLTDDGISDVEHSSQAIGRFAIMNLLIARLIDQHSASSELDTQTNELTLRLADTITEFVEILLVYRRQRRNSI